MGEEKDKEIERLNEYIFILTQAIRHAAETSEIFFLAEIYSLDQRGDYNGVTALVKEKCLPKGLQLETLPTLEPWKPIKTHGVSFAEERSCFQDAVIEMVIKGNLDSASKAADVYRKLYFDTEKTETMLDNRPPSLRWSY